MRIGIDIRELEGGRRTGIGRFLRNFVDHVGRRTEHHLVLYGNQHTGTEGLGAAQTVVLEEGLTAWWDQVRLPRRARRDRLDVFLSPYMKGPLGIDCPLVVTIHDLIDFVFPAYRRGLRGALARAVARRVGLRADLVLTDSEHSRGDIEAILGLPADRIRVLPIGVDGSLRPPDAGAAAAVRARHGLGDPYLFYLGNFKPHKNVQALIRAYAGLTAELRGRVELVLGGRRDDHVPALEALAAQLGVADRVRFLGGVDDGDMAALLGAAEVFVFPSLYEGFGLPPLEAMACGTPVVASNRTSIPEVVGDAARLVDPEDPAALAAALAQVLDDDAERDRLVTAGQARAAGFRAEDLCARQLEALESVAARGRRR